MNKILLGDCIDKLKELEDDSVDLVCTDPPYGIGFMGKEWDTFKPDKVQKDFLKSKGTLKPTVASPAQSAARYDHTNTGAKKFREWFTGISIEMLRVLKPGAFAFVCIGARQDSVAALITAMTEAGFKTDFTSLFWTYASGFPKAMNIGKMVDKRNGTKREITGLSNRAIAKIPKATNYQGTTTFAETAEGREKSKYTTKGNSYLEGSYGGFQPKPAVEVIIVAMKPLSEKTYVDQALKNGKGITWLDDVRIPYSKDNEENIRTNPANVLKNNSVTFKSIAENRNGFAHSLSEDGRFPANLLVSDDVLNDGVDRKSGKMNQDIKGKKWNVYGQMYDRHVETIGDSGSYSRFFSLEAWAQNLPFLQVPKASKSEKNRGLEEFEEETVSDGRPIAIDNAFQRGKTERKNTHPNRLF